MFEASVRYRVRAINKFGNSPYSDVIELPLILGTSDRSDPTVSVYPNPFTNHLTIAVAMLDDEHEGLMYTIQGKPIRNFRLTENETVIDLADLPRGIYYLKLRLMTTHTFKVVKQ